MGSLHLQALRERNTEALAWEATASTCFEAEAMANELYHRIGQDCHERQMAFEAAEYELLSQHPFIKLLSKSPRQD